MSDNHDAIVTSQNAGHVIGDINGMASLGTLASADLGMPVTANPAVMLPVNGQGE